MKERKLYKVILPDSEKYQGRMEKLVHYVRAYSSQQALGFGLAKRNLKPLYEEWKELMDQGIVICEEIRTAKVTDELEEAIKEIREELEAPYQLRLF